MQFFSVYIFTCKYRDKYYMFAIIISSVQLLSKKKIIDFSIKRMNGLKDFLERILSIGVK